MPKATQLSEFERGEIVGLKKANFSYREIARILNRSKSAVEKTVNDYVSKNKTTAALRPKKLSNHDERQLMKKSELFNLLKEEWFNTIPVRINRLVDSMPRRVDAVLKNKGNPTKY
jgi:IS30 family transposase